MQIVDPFGDRRQRGVCVVPQLLYAMSVLLSAGMLILRGTLLMLTCRLVLEQASCSLKLPVHLLDDPASCLGCRLAQVLCSLLASDLRWSLWNW